MDNFILTFICNIFGYLFLAKYFLNITHRNYTANIIIILLVASFTVSLLPTSPITVLLFFLINLMLTYHFFLKSFLLTLKSYIQFLLLKYSLYIVLFLIHTIIFSDINTLIVSNYYILYKNTISNSLIFIFYTLYLTSKKLGSLKRFYKYIFNAIITLSLLMLSYITLYICKNIVPDSFTMPLLFTTIYIFIAIFIIIYDRYVILLNENIQFKISMERARLEADYADSLDAKLKELHSIRHDIKNHLIIIDGYLNLGECDNARKYIAKIQNDFSDTYIIDTPCSSISNILNAKYQLCLKKEITFQFSSYFSNILVDDYLLITILGNLMDNAIEASEKLEKELRIIELSISQLDSYLDICIKNNHREVIIKSGQDFVSTKKESGTADNRLFHGIGLKNVRKTVEKLNGHINIEYTDTTFAVSALIPNY